MRAAALGLFLLAAAGCSSSPAAVAPTATVTVTDDAHSRSVSLVQTAYRGTSVAQAEDMMRSACTIVAANPTPAGVLSARADLVRKGVGTAVQVTTLISAAVAGQCPEHLAALQGI